LLANSIHRGYVRRVTLPVWLENTKEWQTSIVIVIARIRRIEKRKKKKIMRIIYFEDKNHFTSKTHQTEKRMDWLHFPIKTKFVGNLAQKPGNN
tara:strand:- start:497 stop:778 length:282 start_codon:yes stop_codon:yes gene_type:complete